VPELDLDELVARLGPLGVVDVVPMPGTGSTEWVRERLSKLAQSAFAEAAGK